ncbi:hypothetical protein MNBD_NITROSPINAE01-934 [hydrothermal vent metagenome]|uniref:Sulfatase N-terminal domain-containing protein n=1 Tax=hydrothermal vent metagenome TaxID=652676 RepID=A0A3B1BLW6_9ZZZZ
MGKQRHGDLDSGHKGDSLFGGALKIVNNILFTLLATGVLVLSDLSFRAYKGNLPLRFEGEDLYELIGLVFLMSLLSTRMKRFMAFAFIMFLSFIQMVHIVFYGTMIFPFEIWLGFTQAGEIADTLKVLYTSAIAPLGIISIFSVCLFWLIKKMDGKLLGFRYTGIVILIILSLPAIRSYFVNHNFGKQPRVNEHTVRAMIGSLSYFSGRVLPAKLSRPTYAKEKHPVLENADVNANIIFVLGESLRYDHMSLYGYKRKTTPLLDGMVDDKNFIFRKAVSAGVSTDTAVPSIFNVVEGEGAYEKLYTSNTCLFTLARSAGFATHFMSAQGENYLKHIYNYICPGDMDTYYNGSMTTGDYNNGVMDMELFKNLEQIDFSKNNFIVLQQRGSHAPYSKRYTPEFEKFKNKKGDSFRVTMNNEYDNSVLYTDAFLKKVFKFVKSHAGKKPLYVVFTSDHGESLGEDEYYFHAHIHETLFRVPFIFYGVNGEAEVMNMIKSLPQFPRHYDISQILVSLMGYKRTYVYNGTGVHYVSGADMNGFAGYMTVEVKDGKIVEIKKFFD